ncbi:extracellular solute-binding protein [Streptomyces sp. MP131-18]|uniref:extracellular solute-binding protein n=1 Tax=Streptomyces sp. MP131-18 TaxID=1857892 RepID=UPI00097C0FCD|nr:extracellular solute-binding protein [Streptomyces sp. MP131-18]ONK14067.1 Maltose/maltodextrin-binding protein precursor [Streptomyces sp. MP131-18]
MQKLTRRATALAAVAGTGLVLAACGGSDSDGAGGAAELTISANAVSGGKNTEEAEWIEEWVIPRFEAAQAEAGVEVDVSFEPSGVDDEQFKTRLALDLQAGSGPDILTLDGIWVGEFAQAGYVEPLPGLDWEGWDHIPEAVAQLAAYEGELYGIPWGTDGRVLFYNKELFAEAGLPAEWQPGSWADVLDAAEALAGLDGVTPLQLNAGTAMGEATTMQGVLPLLAGTGEEIHDGQDWTGASPGLTRTLQLYEDVYGGGLGDPVLQQEAQGRDRSFEQFAAGELGILVEGDYFWRSVVNPEGGTAPMENRDDAVGWALIPAAEPGTGIAGQDFVSMSGGSVRAVNPASEDAELAYELLTFMNSAEAITAAVEGDARITARTDVNEQVLADDPMLSFVADEVLPLTTYRPPLAEYPQVSVLLQEAAGAVAAGDSSPADAARDYEEGLGEVAGGAD